MTKIDLRNNVSIAASQFVNEKKYWNSLFEDEWERVSFPFDYDGTKSEKSRSTHKVIIEGDEFNKVLKISNESDHRMGMYFLAIISILIRKYTDTILIFLN